MRFVRGDKLQVVNYFSISNDERCGRAIIERLCKVI